MGDTSSDSEQESSRSGEMFYVGQVAEMLGVTPTMVRQWEKHGFVSSSRTESGYRVFSMEQIRSMRRIRDLAQSGINPAGIRLALKDELAAGWDKDAASVPAAVGDKLKRLRTSRKMSLRDLAAVTDLSASHISAIERSVTHPSVAVLHRITSALGTNFVQLLGGSQAAEQALVRPKERKRLDAGLEGVEIEQLFQVETVLESLMFTIDPGACSGESYRHEGEEFLFVLEGTLDIILDQTETFTLAPGDSLTFASHRPHSFVNNGSGKCIVLWVNTPPSF